MSLPKVIAAGLKDFRRAWAWIGPTAGRLPRRPAAEGEESYEILTEMTIEIVRSWPAPAAGTRRGCSARRRKQVDGGAPWHR